jgi:signal recognition particle subunit SRP54
MVLENLGNALRNTIKRVMNAPHIDSAVVKEISKEIQRALLQADVNVKQVLELTKRIETRALTEKPSAGMGSGEHVVHIMYEELSSLLGKGRSIELKKQRILMLGIYGQGKTTSCAKLARYLQKKGLSAGMIAADVHRPAAYDQLKQLSENINCRFYGDIQSTSAVAVVDRGLKELSDCDAIIIDTAGRHKLDDELMEELREINGRVKPEERILVIDATIGQQAKEQAKAFNESVGITGVILTKMDGSAKGGGALSAVAEVGAPIMFIGTGEKIDDIEPFDSDRFISRLLGMGDLQTLLEKAKETIDEKKAEELTKKVMSGRFTLKEFYEEIESVTKIGTLDKIMELVPLPGAKVDKNKMDESQKLFSKFRVVMDSMTEEELESPQIIKGTRIARIARGAGVETKDVKELLRYYNMSRNMMKNMKNRKFMRQLMKMGLG